MCLPRVVARVLRALNSASSKRHVMRFYSLKLCVFGALSH